MNRLTGRNPPGGGGRGDRELGQLIVDDRLAHARLLREVVAEAQAVVIDPEHHIDATLGAAALGQLHHHFVEMIAGQPALAPRLLPGLIDAARLLAEHGEITVQPAVAELEAEPGAVHHGLAEAFDPVAGGAAVQLQ
ncbi:hypothetical protein HDC96_001717 [Stenotrophomonas sp. JAI102]|nr:hypothetical protein [Stenotrophomonas sp. JAI102]